MQKYIITNMHNMFSGLDINNYEVEVYTSSKNQNYSTHLENYNAY